MKPRVACATHQYLPVVSMGADHRSHTSTVRYALMSGDDTAMRKTMFTTDAHEDLRYRFELVPEEVPWKSIALAVVLLAFGCLFLVISQFIYTQHMEGDASQAYGFLVLGLLLFLPGFYETRIAYYSWRGFKGYSYSRIPPY